MTPEQLIEKRNELAARTWPRETRQGFESGWDACMREMGMEPRPKKEEDGNEQPVEK